MRTLQNMFPEYKVMGVRECLDALGWEYIPTEDGGAKNIMCCGQLVSLIGWVGTESAFCKKCGKGMQDLLGFLPASKGSAGLIDADDIDLSDGKHWTPHNILGYTGEGE